MSSLRDQIIANADKKSQKAFIYKMTPGCRSMIAEGMLLFRNGELPIKTISELYRSLQRIAEKQYPEDYAKWPDSGTMKRLYDRMTDQELQEVVDQGNQSQVKNRKTLRNR